MSDILVEALRKIASDTERGRGCALQYRITARTALEKWEKGESDGSDYTFWHLEAAACMWEHVVRELTRKRPLSQLTTDKPAWLEYHDAYGVNALREAVLRHAPEMETHYREALANRYKGDFSRDFVPKYMEDHVTRILT